MVGVDVRISKMTPIPGDKQNSQERVKKRSGGIASKLFNKFDSDRKYDPFADMDPVIQDSKAGMEALLSMCNMVEINSLCGALGITEPSTRTAKTQKIMSYIREAGQGVEKRFAEVMRLFWEGLLFEYLRSVGCPLRDAERDPRTFVTRYWRRSTLEPSVRPGFVPFYLKRELKKRDSIMKEDKDISDIRSGLMLRVDAVKDAEKCMRRQHDYRFVLRYFSASRELHRTLVNNVNYLANEVEQLRAQVDHSGESIAIMQEQFMELETKYDRVVGGLVYRGAFQETLDATLYTVIAHGHANLRAVEDTTRRLLANMERGPGACDDTASSESNVDDKKASSSEVAQPTTLSDDVRTTAPISEHNRRLGHVNLTFGMVGGSTLDGQKWAVPGQRNPEGSRGSQSIDIKELDREAAATTLRANPSAGTDVNNLFADGDHRYAGASRMWSYLERVQKTHNVACARYANRVGELVHRNAYVEREAATAIELRDEAVSHAKGWETRHRHLEETYAQLEGRAKAEVALAEAEAQRERRRAFEATALWNGALEEAMPWLMQLVAGFAPIETEELGVKLFESLGVDADQYDHVIARKRMFEADLESRAFAAIEKERHRATAEGETEELEEAAESSTERGRPKSRGKASRPSGANIKGSSKSKSKSTTAKQIKVVDKSQKAQGSGENSGKTGAVKARKPKATPAGAKGESSVKQGSGGKGAPSDQDAKAKALRSASPAKEPTPKSKKK